MHSVSGSALVQDFHDIQHCTDLNEEGSCRSSEVRRGHVLKRTEEEAKRLYPGPVIAFNGTPTERSQQVYFMMDPMGYLSTGEPKSEIRRGADGLRSQTRKEEKAKRGEKTFTLTADEKDAQRQIPVACQDWRLLGGRARPATFVFFNKVGTFAISSATYYWSRIGSGIGRLVQYAASSSAATWIMLVAAGDEWCFISCRSHRVLRCMLISRCPTIMGQDFSAYRLRVSQRRAEWICRWCKEMSTTESVNTAVFEEGWSRITHVAGALEYERAFLSPLCKFLTIPPRGGVRRIPSYVRFVLRYTASEIEKCRTYDCAVETERSHEGQREDAQASDQRTGIVDWYPEVDG